jgi:hypothetical protein
LRISSGRGSRFRGTEPDEHARERTADLYQARAGLGRNVRPRAVLHQPSDPYFINFGLCTQTQVLYFSPGVYSFASSVTLTTDNLSTNTKSDYFDVVAGTRRSWWAMP